MGDNTQNTDNERFQQQIDELGNRITRLENEFNKIGFLRPAKSGIQQGVTEGAENNLASDQNEAIESRIGEYGMAWLGNIVLLFGILFLTQYLQKNDHELIALLFGIVSVTAVYLIGYFTRSSLPYMSRLFHYNGHLLLFIQVMRISLFRESRMIENQYIGIALVLIVLIAIIYLAYRNQSELLAVIGLLMAVVAGITTGDTHIILPMMVAVAGTGFLLVLRKGWWTGLIISIVFVYLMYLVWLFGNPFINSSFGIIKEHQMGYIYIFACALLYSLLAMFPKTDKVPPRLLNAAILLNGLSFSLVITMTVLAFFTENYFIHFGLIAAFSIAYSIILQVRIVWKNIAALYALYGFVALSITVAGIFHFPRAFLLLSIESLLVVSMALWFRSRFIVIMNTLLFVGLMITYLALSGSLDTTNFSFAMVALVTARIMNWKKKRLDIRTELIRNIFLISGALMMLFSLHHALPPQLVTLSWALLSVVFFVLSVIIHNMKYRWLAIITMVITVFYLFIVDLSNISLGYRIVALMFIAAISLGISIFYSKRHTGKKT